MEPLLVRYMYHVTDMGAVQVFRLLQHVRNVHVQNGGHDDVEDQCHNDQDVNPPHVRDVQDDVEDPCRNDHDVDDVEDPFHMSP